MAERTMVPVADPDAGYLAHKAEIDEAIHRVLESGHYILGPEVESFEDEFASYLEVPSSVGVGNGTDGIALALRSLDIGPGDEVITVSHTAVATVAAIEQVGARPVLVDVEPGFLTLDPQHLPDALSSRTRAIIPVHLYGQPADLHPIELFCRQHGLALIEDASQAHGAKYDGRMVGSFGEAGVFSCYPTKNLGALGDAGVVVFKDSHVAERARRLRQYGWKERNNSLEPGVNTRLDEIQAAVLRVKLRHLESANAMRRRHASAYLRGLTDVSMGLPKHRIGASHVFHLFVVEVRERARLMDYLAHHGVASAVHFPLPVHLQSAYLQQTRTGEGLPVTESAAASVLSLPMYPELDGRDVDRVIDVVGQFFTSGEAAAAQD